MPGEVETLLRVRLVRRIDQKLLPDLRQRLREYSGGLCLAEETGWSPDSGDLLQELHKNGC